MSDGGDESGHAATLLLEGELDLTTVAGYEDRIERAASAADDGIAVDLSGLEFIDTAGVAMLFRKARELAAEAGGIAYVASPGSLARRVIAIAYLPFHENLRDAYRSLAAAKREVGVAPP
jgi:anti-anti-sigma factor